MKRVPYLALLDYIKATVVLGILVFPVSFSSAQDQELPELPSALVDEAPTLRFEHLAQEDGLTQVSANTIMQDSQGFIWVATQGGLHRYDGQEFKVYTEVPFDTTSLSASWIWGVSEASNGDLWVGTEAGGLNRFDRATETFKAYRNDPDDSTSISSDRIFYPFEDSRGDLWVGSLGDGLNRMKANDDGVFTRFEHVHEDSTTLSGRVVFYINEDEEGFVWVGTSNGLSRIDPETDEVTRVLFETEDHVGYGSRRNVIGIHFSADSPNTAWLGTGDGVVKLNTETFEYERFQIEPDNERNPLNFIHDVQPDPNLAHILWVAGPGTGIARFDTESKKFTSYRNNPLDPNSLSENFTQSLLTDQSGTIWVGTSNKGVNKFNPGAVNFSHLRNNPQNDQSLAPGNVWGVYEDSEGTMWVGTDVGQAGDFLTQFDARTGRIIRHQFDPNDVNTIPRNSIRVFAEDSRNRMYIGGSGGFGRIDRRTGRVTRIEHERIPENRAKFILFAIKADPSDSDIFWIASAGGLDALDTRTDTYTSYPFYSDSLKDEPVILELLHASDGLLWAGTTDGLFKFDREKGAAELFSAYDVADTTSISSNFAHGLVERVQEPGILWMGTSGGGLNRIDTRTGRTTHYFAKDGLADNTQYGILLDEAGTLWMSTNNGISNFDPETETFRNYGLDDGLIAVEYNQNAFYKGAGGVMYFGSSEGVTAFLPENLQVNQTPPQVAFTDFKLFNKSVKVGDGSPLPRPLSKLDKITLKHNQNEFTFNFVALHYGNPKMNTYAYMLVGHDPDWIDGGTAHSATYTNLQHGEYTFRVKAANADGIWNDEGISIGLTITPPWWLTWWAYFLYAALLAVGVFTVDRVQRARLRRKEAERSQIREVELLAQSENQRREDAERLSEMGRAITSTLSTREVIDTVYGQVNAMIDAAVFGIGVYNEENNRIDFPATKENGETLKFFSNSLDNPGRPSVWCFKNRKEFIVGDFANEYEKYLPTSDAPLAGEAASSVIYLPLIHQDKAVGVITTQSFKKNAYTDYDVSVLRTLAAYAAIAIDNANAYRKIGSTLSDLKATQQQLVQSEKMASLGALTAGIAHEIKNPLNFINNFAEVNEELAGELRIALANGEPVEDLVADLEQNATVILQHGKRADSIVKSMMQHASGGKGQRVDTDVNALVAEHVGLAYHGKRVQLPELNVRLETDYAENTGTAVMIPQDVGRVLLNIVGNAFDAVYEHATTRNDGYIPTVTVSTRKLSRSVEIRVSDDGPGIPKKIRDRIFEPFFTTKPTGLGTGLGLSLSHDIITQGHGGNLTVESEPGQGATFVVTLPVDQA